MFVLGNTLAGQARGWLRIPCCHLLPTTPARPASALATHAGTPSPAQVLGNAAVSRGFSYFLAQLCGRPPTFFNVGSSSVNPVAFGINVVIALLVATGVRESAFFITGVLASPADVV